MLQRVMSQIATVKKDMIILEKSEFSTLLAENEVNVVFVCGCSCDLCDHVRVVLFFDPHHIKFSIF